ncbi:hypothetical protein HK096_007349, partial [Nowakowskiella sp. JEL0078]
MIASRLTFGFVLLGLLSASPVEIQRRQTVDPWSPPSSMVQPLSEVWAKYLSINPNYFTSFNNFGFDQLIATGGTINYCVRWESTDTLTANQRTLLESEVGRQFNKWISWLSGFDNWPYPTVKVKVVGYASASKSTLGFEPSSGQTFYLNDKDDGGIPQCSPGCGRFFHQNNDYSSCPGGAASHYDMSLWLTKGMGGGAGGDWGQRVDSQYFTSLLESKAENIHIYLHEVGHSFGLMDFYDWTPTGETNFVMKAGSATLITDFDGWMLRDIWRHIRYRYPSIPAPGTTTTTKATTTSTTTTTKVTTSATTTPRTTTSTTSSKAVVTTTTANSSCAALYAQCGGQTYTGPTCCQSGST